jgi:hypothetical protein
MGFDYIENWDTEEGKKYILTQVEEGKIAYDTPVYQYVCQCGQQVVVDIRTVALGLKTHKKHSRRRRCNKCYQRLAHKRTPHSRPPHKLSASTPKNGPGAGINKIRHAKHKGPEAKSLPPLEAVLPAQRLSELDKKALEKLNAQE